ncbi:hypothetical protein [Pseudonocardia sp. HH130630-07]|uniref:hypothetical protein n=1 Tax=Pseudonocardia sp. HH130630-07 TaxID=1690815 RepID=UPI0012EAEDB0|nr:hypothetical protein [Pseudonocardia sp. HH130630-07]
MSPGPSPERLVRDPVAQPDDLDPRLLSPTGRTERLRMVVEHYVPTAGRCPSCRWTVQRREECPSRQVALALLENRPLPARLGHLADVVPGARAGRDSAADRDRRRDELDAMSGLFAAPARTPEREDTR